MVEGVGLVTSSFPLHSFPLGRCFLLGFTLGRCLFLGCLQFPLGLAAVFAEEVGCFCNFRYLESISR